MGNYRFRISNMMPNAWFYKLRDMSKSSSSRNHSIRKSHHSIPTNTCTTPKSLLPSHHQQTFLPSRASYYISSRAGEAEKLPSSPVNPKVSDTHFPLEPPRPSKRKARRKPKLVASSVSASCGCRASLPELPAAGSDIIIELPPILTKPSQEVEQLQSRKSPPPTIQRLRLRGNSPRVVSRKPKNKPTQQQQQGRKKGGWTQSFAVVKASSDPQKDFRESMVEMIVENNIRAAKDLEELLACYLSLNSDEYHDLIVKVFEQIWFDFIDLRS